MKEILERSQLEPVESEYEFNPDENQAPDLKKFMDRKKEEFPKGVTSMARGKRQDQFYAELSGQYIKLLEGLNLGARSGKEKKQAMKFLDNTIDPYLEKKGQELGFNTDFQFRKEGIWAEYATMESFRTLFAPVNPKIIMFDSDVDTEHKIDFALEVNLNPSSKKRFFIQVKSSNAFNEAVWVAGKSSTELRKESKKLVASKHRGGSNTSKIERSLGLDNLEKIFEYVKGQASGKDSSVAFLIIPSALKASGKSPFEYGVPSDDFMRMVGLAYSAALKRSKQ